MEIIKTLKQEKQEIIRETFISKGIPEILSEVSFKIDTSDSSGKVLKKFISAVKKKFKKEYLTKPREKRMEYLESIKIHSHLYHVKVEPYNTDEWTAKFDHISRLVRTCSVLDSTAKQPDMVQVTIQNGSNTLVGYGLLNGEIKPSYHQSRRRMNHRHTGTYELLLDLPSLLAEIVVVQSLISFAEKDNELMKYLIVQDYTMNRYRPLMPEDEDYKQDFLDVAARYDFPTEGLKEDKLQQRIKDLFYNGKVEYVGAEKGTYKTDSILPLVVNEFVRISNYAIAAAEVEFANRSQYAKSFQTKKHIKKTHLERMESNDILQKYKYVELDSDVDLEKFKVYEENFKALIKQVHIPYSDTHSFRIKKLGQHKAAGLYYHGFQTTIVDIRYPDSYMHEAFHQIDFMLGEKQLVNCYSETMKFRSISDLYKRLVNQAIDALDKDDAFNKQWNGKSSKFGKLYYFEPTEIFARCGEIYMAAKYKENSLFKSKEDLQKTFNAAVYPLKDELIEKIIPFYDGIFELTKQEFPDKPKEKTINKLVQKQVVETPENNKKSASSSVPSKPIRKREVEAYTHIEQISIFELLG